MYIFYTENNLMLGKISYHQLTALNDLLKDSCSLVLLAQHFLSCLNVVKIVKNWF